MLGPRCSATSAGSGLAFRLGAPGARCVSISWPSELLMGPTRHGSPVLAESRAGPALTEGSPGLVPVLWYPNPGLRALVALGMLMQRAPERPGHVATSGDWLLDGLEYGERRPPSRSGARRGTNVAGRRVIAGCRTNLPVYPTRRGGSVREERRGGAASSSIRLIPALSESGGDIRPNLERARPPGRGLGPLRRCAVKRHGTNGQALSSSREIARRMKRAASALLPPSFWPSSCSRASPRSPSI